MGEDSSIRQAAEVDVAAFHELVEQVHAP